MNPVHRAYFPPACLCLVIGIFGTCAVTRAQSQSAPLPAIESQTRALQKPVRKPDWELTKDSVVLLGVRRAAANGATNGQLLEGAKKEADPVAEEMAKKAVDSAPLEQQIKDKQKKIALLMRLFVDDERPFLNDPGNTKVDGTLQDRRKYEQDELLFETAELAKLKAKLNEATAKEEKPAVSSR